MMSTGMVGREVRAGDDEGIVVRWEPLGAGMCDALVRFHATGREVWHGSSSLRPVGILAGIPLPSRHEAREEARARATAQLRTIRARLVAEFHHPWPGVEHGKALVGRAIDGALVELEAKTT